MIVEKIKDKITLTIKVEGRIDSITSQQLREDLSDVDFNSYNKVVFDFKKLDYISSAGLRELLIIKKKISNGTLEAINVNEDVKNILELTGFDNVLDIIVKQEETVDFSRFSFKKFLEYKVKVSRDKVILSDAMREYTYLDVDKYSNIVAEDLIKLGVKKGTHVAICSLNSVNWIMTFFAIQKLGAIAILVNPTLTASEILALAKIGDITHFCFGLIPQMLSDKDAFFKEILNEDNSPIKYAYDIISPIKDREISVVSENMLSLINVENDDPCVMIYTSGSTGTPKGVLLSSFNILTASKCGKELGTTEEDSSCILLPLFHIFGLAATFFASAMFDTKVVFPTTVRTNDILDILSIRKCTVMNSVPTLLIALTNNPNFSTDKVASIKTSVVGGAPISAKQMLLLQSKFPNTQFYNVYGLSEMAPVSYTRNNDSLETITSTIGKPSSFVKVKIQNPVTLEDAKNLETGEIIVQGDSLMSGYYKTPIEKQDFDTNGWFHTGDLGYMDDNGYLHYAGRKKEIIIKGGENILPVEIAAKVTEEECVSNVQVFGVPSDFWGEEIAVVITLKNGYTFNKEEMLEHLKGKLSKTKLPDYIYAFESLPFLANGKIDVVGLKKTVLEKIKEETK